jgi:uncharacterized membrane protein
MVFAAVTDGLYKVLFLGHMVSFLVAFAPAVINPILGAQLKGDGDVTAYRKAVAHMGLNGRRIHFPAVIALGAFGLAMVIVSDEVWAFDQTWVSLSFLVWLAICGVVSGLILPSERKLAAGDDAAEVKLERGGQAVTLLLLVMLYLMIWKPGL